MTALRMPHAELDSVIAQLTARYFDTHDSVTGELLPRDEWAHGSTWGDDPAPTKVVMDIDQGSSTDFLEWLRAQIRRRGHGIA